MPTFQEVTQALVNCMTAEPPIDCSLSMDASQLATVYAEMMHFKQTERSIDDLSVTQMNAYVRWSAPSSATANDEH